MQCVRQHLEDVRAPSSSHTLSRLKEKGIRAGEGAQCTLRGATRRRLNQIKIQTICFQTLRWLLAAMCEQELTCPDYDVLNAYHK